MSKKKHSKRPSSGPARRKVLKVVGSTSLAAGALWKKPVLNTVVVPAHAQTSPEPPEPPLPPVTLGGATSLNSPFASVDSGNSQGIAGAISEALIPSAHAQTFDRTLDVVCDAFTTEPAYAQPDDDYGHCITLNIPRTADGPTSVDVTLTGPEVYDQRSGSSYDYSTSIRTYYYNYATNFSGTSSGAPLTPVAGGFEFSVNINGLQINGIISEDLQLARGTLTNEIGRDILVRNPYYYCYPASNHGAYWTADDSNLSCTYGAGVANDHPLVVNYPD